MRVGLDALDAPVAQPDHAIGHAGDGRVVRDHDGGGAQNPTFRLVVTQFAPAIRTGTYNLEAVLIRLQQLLPGANANNVTVPDLTTGLSQFALVWTSVAAAL